MMDACNTTRPMLLGRLAVYADDLHTAWRVYAAVSIERQPRHFGTVILDTGQEIDWVDMTGGVFPPHDSNSDADEDAKGGLKNEAFS